MRRGCSSPQDRCPRRHERPAIASPSVRSPSNELAARARQTLTDAGYPSVPREVDTRVLDGYWVYLEAPPTEAGERRLLERLRRGGIDGCAADGRSRRARRISLGFFSDEGRAAAQSERVAKLQLLPQIEAREKPGTAIWLDLSLKSDAPSLEGQKFRPAIRSWNSGPARRALGGEEPRKPGRPAAESPTRAIVRAWPRGLESRHFQGAGLAQLVEHLICNQGVAGSIPAAGTNLSPDHRLVPTITLIGPGAIGATLATWLCQDPRNVVTVAARTPFDAIELESPYGPLRATPRVITDRVQATHADWVLAATKTYDSESATQWFENAVGPTTRLAVIQNGVEQVERFANYLDRARIVPVMIDLPADRLSPGRVKQNGPGKILVPSGRNGAEFVALFEKTEDRRAGHR